MKKEISSLTHSLVRHVTLLRTDPAYRKTHQMMVIEGIKPVQEIPSGKIRQLIYLDEGIVRGLKADEKWQVTEPLLRKMSGMTHPEGVLAVVDQPAYMPLGDSKWVVALDGVSDPGNMGTLLRTALAFGWQTIFLLPGCCDPYNDKVLRSARGAHFHLKIAKGSSDELHKWVEENGVQSLVADLDGIKSEDVKKSSKRLLILGNEAHGPSEDVMQFSTKITLPMEGEIESLNVAVAGGILMYLLRKV
jgi:RNA methyltransferase, TrmH family